MKPLGQATLHTNYKGKHYKLRFYVVPLCHAQKPLLSANTCEHLKLTVNVNMSEHIESLSKEKILHKYKDVFEGLGCFKGEYHIQIDENVKPVQHAPWCIPLAIREELKLKIDKMVKDGILAKVTEPTEWISSLVVVKKPSKLRICFDPKDLNRAIKRTNYQILTIEQVLPHLRKAKVYFVLDVKDGFYHVKLDTPSSYLTTFWTPFGKY